jgi:hypothetical protein
MVRSEKPVVIEIEFGLEGRLRWTCRSEICLEDSRFFFGEPTGTAADELLEEEREGLHHPVCSHCCEETPIEVHALGDSWKWLLLGEDSRAKVLGGQLTWEEATSGLGDERPAFPITPAGGAEE